VKALLNQLSNEAKATFLLVVLPLVVRLALLLHKNVQITHFASFMK